jgi:hypothetical protein
MGGSFQKKKRLLRSLLPRLAPCHFLPRVGRRTSGRAFLRRPQPIEEEGATLDCSFLILKS